MDPGELNNWVESYDVTDPSNVTKVGEINESLESPGKSLKARFIGSWSIFFEGREVRGYCFYRL